MQNLCRRLLPLEATASTVGCWHWSLSWNFRAGVQLLLRIRLAAVLLQSDTIFRLGGHHIAQHSHYHRQMLAVTAQPLTVVNLITTCDMTLGIWTNDWHVSPGTDGRQLTDAYTRSAVQTVQTVQYSQQTGSLRRWPLGYEREVSTPYCCCVHVFNICLRSPLVR